MNDNDLQAIRDFVAKPHSDTGWVVFAQTAVPALLAEVDALAAELRKVRSDYDYDVYAAKKYAAEDRTIAADELRKANAERDALAAEVAALRAQEWRELAEAATPGPWSPVTRISGLGVETFDSLRVCHVGESTDEYMHDATFIAASRTAVPALLAEVDALAAQRDNAYRLLEGLTPGGSEFYNSPQNCAQFAQSRMSSVTQIAKERNELRAERDALRRELEETRCVRKDRFVELGEFTAMRAERDALAAEVATLRAQLATVQDYANYYYNFDGWEPVMLFNEWYTAQQQEAAYYAALDAQQQREHAEPQPVAGDVDDDGGYCGPTCGSRGNW